jgi:hypothetical protein
MAVLGPAQRPGPAWHLEEGRPELHCTCLPHLRSGGSRPSDLRFLLLFGDRSCPLLSVVCLPAADLARTDGASDPVRSRTPPALRSSATRDRIGSLEPLRFERQHLGMAEGRGITGALSVASRHYVAGQHLWSARHHALLCAELEIEKTGRTPFDIQHRAYAVNAVLSAVVFLEALVNETFQDAADGHASRIAPLDQRYIALMGEFWNASEMGGRYVSILDKYQMALLFADRRRLDPGAAPYQDAKLLIGIRNRLVHFRPAFTTAGEETKEEAQLKGKFAQNALMAGSGNPWFPDKCLGAGCAQWSWKTSLALADEWTKRLGIPRPYQADNDRWPQP